MRLSLLISALFLFTSFLPPEAPTISRLNYKVWKDGKEIGYIKATKNTDGETIIYDVETYMTIKILLNQKIKYTSKTVYQNGILYNSISRSFLNDKQHSFCVTTFKNGKYLVKTDKLEYSLNRSIQYSGTMLYFKEPNTNLVYSEMSGQDNMVRKVASGHYVLTNVKSKKQNKYWYKGGILEKADINHALADIEIQRVN